MILPCLVITPTNKMGRGVRTTEDIAASTVIEISPVIVMGKEDRKLLDKTLLHDYLFEWGKTRKQCCVALGYLSVYNHSYRSNCEYEMDYEGEIMSIRTIIAVHAGDELFINYNGDWNNKKAVWFETSTP